VVFTWIAVAHGSGGTLGWLALVLTYSLHVLVWAGALACFDGAFELAPRFRNTCFKVALFAPLLSTLAALLLPLERGSQAEPATTRALWRAPASSLDATAWSGRLEGAASLVSAAAGLGLLKFLAELAALRSGLARRRAVREPRLLERLQRLQRRSGLASVTLSETTGIESPLVLGRREICVPLAVVSKLSDAELDAVFAHELAHLERGDGLWFPAVRCLHSVFWLHPANHWLASRFRASAELASDDRAVALTGDAPALARALVRVATARRARERLAPTPSMVRPASGLARRVRRLTEAQRALPLDGARARRWSFATLGVAGAMAVTTSVRIVEAGPAPRATSAAGTAPLASADAAVPAPDPVERGRRLAESLRRERELERELATSTASPQAERVGTPEAVHVLELEQALRHVRATELWLEQSFVEASRRAASRSH
jgi:beta-lactamase regulating signal transducer with metallopeptidase domain